MIDASVRGSLCAEDLKRIASEAKGLGDQFPSEEELESELMRRVGPELSSINSEVKKLALDRKWLSCELVNDLEFVVGRVD